MMPAGTYFIGDLCYVMHDEWDEFCDITTSGNSCLDGEFALKDGRRFASYGTAHGDGEYRDGRGGRYPVDAGLIGCILLSDIDRSNPDNDTSLGSIVTFATPFETGYHNGEISFGDVNIETDFSEEDDENIWDNDYDDDY